jgi:ABC-type transport system involved in multi-copper enzyme maturation permease subunit
MTESNPMTERVGFSLHRVGVIAANTLTEAVRQRVFNFFLIIGLVFIASASFFAQFSFGEQLKFIKDTCLGVISVISTLIAIVGTAQLLPNEVENRTIYTILAKPVRRIEFLLGKFLGSLLLLGVSIIAMSFLFGAVLFIKEQGMIRELRQQITAGMPAADVADLNQQIRQVQKDTLDVDLVKAVLADLAKATLVASITLLVSTFSTSLVFNVVVPFMIFIAGMLRGSAADMWGDRPILMTLLAIVPDFGFFSLADEINLGNVVPWPHVGAIILYGLARTVVIIIAAHLIFSRREI